MNPRPVCSIAVRLQKQHRLQPPHAQPFHASGTGCRSYGQIPGRSAGSAREPDRTSTRSTSPHLPSVLIDLGARSSRLFAYCENEVVAASTLHCGGDKLDDAIVAGVMNKFSIRINDLEAQNCKHRVGCAVEASYGQRLRNSCQATGHSLENNEEIRFQISTEDMQEMMDPELEQLGATIHTAINTLPLWIQDVIEQKGITLTGGGALLPQMDQLAMEASDVPVEIAHRPLSSAVRGGSTMLERIHVGT